MKLAEDVPYTIVRTHRRTADVVIERDGQILARAPRKFTAKRILELVTAKRLWIYKNLAEWRDLNATRVIREYRNGEGFLYLGRNYRLSLVENQNDLLALKNGRFCLRRDLADQGGLKAARAAFRAFYTQQGRERIAHRVAYFAPKVGVDFGKVEIRDTKYRWAVCSPAGNLAFHWKCLMAPPAVIDYIVVHELCHRHHLDHTEAFWNEIDKILPDYRERKEWLRVNGASLDV